jgi:dienelactone hydrolase
MTRSTRVFATLAVVTVATFAGCKERQSEPSATTTTSAGSTAPSSPGQTEHVAEVPLKELAAQVVGWLDQGENGKVRALFDDAMNKAVPTDAAVGQMWSGIIAKAGKLEKVVEQTEVEKGGYHVVLVTCRFALSPMDVKLVFDKDRHIAGFFIVPTQSTNVYGPRPQTPKPPFEYEVREVSYDNEADKMHFAGTLTVPKGAGPFPAVLLITGSGTQDRDETLFGHKPFFVIADRLTKSGIAVLRVDDPGIGGSTGDVKSATVETHARDAEAGLAFLAKQKEIDPARMGLIGHSEGGIIAAVVGSRAKNVAFVVSLAGTGLSGAEINPLQIEAILRGEGKMKEDGIKAIVDAQRKLMKLVANDASDKELEAATKEAFDAATKYAGSDAEKQATENELKESLATLNTPWFKSFVKLDPAAYWSKVTVPVLALVGDKDTQVPADPNLDAIKTALAKAKNKDVALEKLAGLNHLFQPAKTGLLDEYGAIETTFDEKALDRITEWLTKHTSPAK